MKHKMNQSRNARGPEEVEKIHVTLIPINPLQHSQHNGWSVSQSSDLNSSATHTSISLVHLSPKRVHSGCDGFFNIYTQKQMYGCCKHNLPYNDYRVIFIWLSQKGRDSLQVLRSLEWIDLFLFLKPVTKTQPEGDCYYDNSGTSGTRRLSFFR